MSQYVHCAIIFSLKPWGTVRSTEEQAFGRDLHNLKPTSLLHVLVELHSNVLQPLPKDLLMNISQHACKNIRATNLLTNQN